MSRHRFLWTRRHDSCGRVRDYSTQLRGCYVAGGADDGSRQQPDAVEISGRAGSQSGAAHTVSRVSMMRAGWLVSSQTFQQGFPLMDLAVLASLLILRCSHWTAAT